MTLLDEIFAHKRAEVARQKESVPLDVLQEAARQVDAPLDFIGALRNSPHRPALIAEVKHLQPSRGLLATYFDPLELARVYAANGAAAISVLTDERYFDGNLDDLRRIRRALPQMPLLRKDFFCDPYQLYEARATGADAILLVVAGLDDDALYELHTQALELGMTPLVEVHSKGDVGRALPVKPRLIGINHRDFRDGTVKLETTFQVRPLIPAGMCVVSESGIHTREAVEVMAAADVDAILVGEALVAARDIPAQVRLLAGRL